MDGRGSCFHEVVGISCAVKWALMDERAWRLSVWISVDQPRDVGKGSREVKARQRA